MGHQSSSRPLPEEAPPLSSDPEGPACRLTYVIGGDLAVHRLGFGNMQLTGPGVWGEPRNRSDALRVLRRAVDLGVNFIDTADSYGPHVAEELTAEALYPYPANLIIATKAGLARTGPGEWHPLGRPEYLRQQCEMSLRRLRLERIDLYQLHRVDPQVALEDQVGELAALQREGKIRHIGLSEVTIAQVQAALRIVAVVSVQNRYNLIDRAADPLIDYCQTHTMAFIPWFPLANGQLAVQQSALALIAAQTRATPAQVTLAWLLGRAPNILPIPGTSSLEHLEGNMAAARLELSDEQRRELEVSV